jgi:MFS family permease
MKAAAIYFALVFGTGFVLGPLRVLWLVPRVGVRAAELIEIPLMLVAIVLAAGFVIRRFPKVPRIQTGLIAVCLLLAAEVCLGVALNDRSVTQVLFDRDPISGSAYYAALAAFAIMPWWLSRR